MAYQLNGTSGYLYAAAQSAITSTATLSAWLKRDVGTPSSTTHTGFFSLGLDEPSENSHYPYTNGLGYFAVFRDAGARIDAVSLGSADRTLWHHVAITSQPGTNGWKLYINGQLVHQESGHSTISFRTGDWRLGRSGSSGQYYFEGAIAEVAIWNVALTGDEVASLARGFVATIFTHRLANLVIYQDLVRQLDRPGFGASVAASGGTSIARHPPIFAPRGATCITEHYFPWLLPITTAVGQAELAGSVSGDSFVPGADIGSVVPAGEVAS